MEGDARFMRLNVAQKLNQQSLWFTAPLSCEYRNPLGRTVWWSVRVWVWWCVGVVWVCECSMGVVVCARNVGVVWV